MKISLRIRMTLILSFSLISLIVLCWAVNVLFLGRYYTAKKVNGLQYSYNDLLTLMQSEDYRSPTTVNAIERIEAANGVNIYLISVSSLPYGKITFDYPLQLDMSKAGSSDDSIVKMDSYKRISSALMAYIYGTSSCEEARLLYSDKQNYDVYKYYSSDIDSTYIDLVGNLKNDQLAFIRTSYQNIQESAQISNTFLGFIGVFIILIGSIVMFIVSKRFVKPIIQLSRISDSMASLNFEARYTGKNYDEIGLLGKSINRLSEKLEKTISELKTANIELEHDIAKKTEIDEMRREFLSNVSHELKTPIALIQGYAEGLSDNISDDPESRQFYCEVIMDEAKKMNNLVRKLLSLNEIESGLIKLDLERFDICELTASLCASMKRVTDEKNINVVLNRQESIYVWADPLLIEDVLTNYFTNAINHIDGMRVIDIRFTKKDDNTVRVSVFNTGENIPDEYLDDIWDKFFKVDKARTREYGGSGIGLSVVKAIMENHNKNYGVMNRTSGVEFWFELDIQAED